MITIRLDAQVREHTSSSVETRFQDDGCGGCGKACASSRALTLPGQFRQDHVRISMSGMILGKLLVNSLYLPLAMFVILPLVVSCVNPSEIVQGLAAVAGLVLGMIGCRTMTFNDIRIE